MALSLFLRRQLHDTLCAYFNRSELEILAWRYLPEGIIHDVEHEKNLSLFAKSLIDQCRKQGLVEDLLDSVHKERPKIVATHNLKVWWEHRKLISTLEQRSNLSNLQSWLLFLREDTDKNHTESDDKIYQFILYCHTHDLIDIVYDRVKKPASGPSKLVPSNPQPPSKLERAKLTSPKKFSPKPWVQNIKQHVMGGGLFLTFMVGMILFLSNGNLLSEADNATQGTGTVTSQIAAPTEKPERKVQQTTTPTNTPTPTTTSTNTSVPPTLTFSATPTATPTNTPLPPTATPSATPTATPTNTPLPPTATPSTTPTTTPTNIPLPPTPTPSATPTATSTNTPLPPTVTPTNTPLPPTVTPTNTPLPPTATPTNTPTPSATPTNTPLPPTATPTNTPTSDSATTSRPALDASNVDRLGQAVRLGYGELRTMAYSSDGEMLIIGTPVGFFVYALENLSEEPRYISTTFAVDSLAFSPSGQLAVGLDDGQVQLWDTDSWKVVQSFSADDQAISSVSFSADGSHIATGSETIAQVWKVDGDTFSRKLTIEHESTIHSVALSLDGSFLATGTDNQLNLWRTRDGRNVSPSFSDLPHTSEVIAVAFSASNHYLASASADEVYLWDVISNPDQDTLKLTSPTLVSSTPDVTTLAFSPDETELTIGLSNGITSWQIENNTLTSESLITGFSKDINRVAISRTGLLASGTLNGQIHLWQLDGSLLLSSTTPRYTTIRGLAFSPDGSRLAAGFTDGSVRVWKIQNDNLVYSGGYTHDHFVNSIAFSAKNQLVSVSDDGLIWFWGNDLNTQVSLSSKVKSVAFSPDGAFAVAGSADGTVWKIDVDTLTPTEVRTHQSAVSSVTVSSNNCLASTSVNEIQVQQLSEPCPLSQIVASGQITNRDITQLVFSNDDALLVSVSNNHYIDVWEVHTSHLVRVLSYETRASVSDVAISHDGGVLAFAFEDGTVRLWAIQD